MTKKIMAVVLVLLMLVLGGVKLNASDTCNRIGQRHKSRCEGNTCMKNGQYSAHLVVEVFGIYNCYTENGSSYTVEQPEGEYNSGCC